MNPRPTTLPPKYSTYKSKEYFKINFDASDLEKAFFKSIVMDSLEKLLDDISYKDDNHIKKMILK